MKLSIRTLKGDSYTVEVAADETVLALKHKLHQKHSNFRPECTVLVYKGNKLSDDSRLCDGPTPVRDEAVLHAVVQSVAQTNNGQAVYAYPQPTIVQLPAAISSPQVQVIGAPAGYNSFPYLVNVATGGPTADVYVPGVLTASPTAQVERDLTRSAMSNQIVGYVYVIAGLIYFVIGFVEMRWASIVNGALIVGLGALALQTRLVSTRFARIYLRALLFFFFVGTVIWTVDFSTSSQYETDDGSKPSVWAALLSAAILAFLSTILCVYLATVHLEHCVHRDRLVLSQQPFSSSIPQPTAAGDPNAMPELELSAVPSAFTITDDAPPTSSANSRVATPAAAPTAAAGSFEGGPIAPVPRAASRPPVLSSLPAEVIDEHDARTQTPLDPASSFTIQVSEGDGIEPLHESDHHIGDTEPLFKREPAREKAA